MSTSEYQKKIVFETDEGIQVIDYSVYSYIVKTSVAWYSIEENKKIIRETLKDGKFAKGFKFNEDTFSGWKFDKKKNPEAKLREVFCKCEN